MRTIEDAADRAPETDRELRLVRVPPIVRRTFDQAGSPGDRAWRCRRPTPSRPITGTREESLRVANVFQSLTQLEEAASEAEAASGLAARCSPR